MTSTTKNISSNSSSLTSSKVTTPQSTCNICKRLLYQFEEVLCCRICHGSCHWRCVERKTISQYGENGNYICDKCTGDGTVTNSSEQMTNGSTKLKPTDSINRSYRDFVNAPSKTSSGETNVVNAIRYFEEKQQQQQQQQQPPPTPKLTKLTELDRYLPSNTNDVEYHHNEQMSSLVQTSLLAFAPTPDSIRQEKNDSSRPSPRTPSPQHHEIESDEENDTSAMFQANYQYTPLKDYAAMRTTRMTSEDNINDYQNSSLDRQTTSRYSGGLHYTNHGYDPTVSRLVEVPITGSAHLISPTISNLANHTHQSNYISTTSLNINEKSSHRPQQQTSPIQSTPYLSQLADHHSPIMKSSAQQQHDRHLVVDSDSGIHMTNSNVQPSHETLTAEKKLTDLVQQLGKQLENDATKINEKLESKLKNLENMIHQQTHVIQRQDEVIEHLKSKILKIETERDQCRDQLTTQNETKKTLTSNNNDRFPRQESIKTPIKQLNRKYSDASTTMTDNSKASSKKTPAPRIEPQWSTTSEENKPTLAKLVKSVPANRDRVVSDSSSVPSTTSKLASSVPLNEPSAASIRLDNVIHQPDGKENNNPSSSNYSLAQVRHQGRSQLVGPVSMTQQQIVTSVHHDENNSDNKRNVVKSKRSNSMSTSSSTSSIEPTRASHKTATSPAARTTTSDRNSQIHRSVESLQNTYPNDQPLRTSNKTTSLEFGSKPLQNEDSGSIYITPVEANQPAIQANSIVKGWLRKQNRDSYLKRIEPYYCILANNALLMHRTEHDRTPIKAINLKGAKVLYYEDAKHGPSLELSWSSRTNDAKHYHLYAGNLQEAEQWVNGIQTTIHNLETQNKWKQYRLNM